MEIKTLREKAARGILLTFEELKIFIKATRKSYTAAEEKAKAKVPGKTMSRTKAPVQQDIDFF